MGFCNNCNQEISTKFCPNCGKEATETIRSTKSDTPALIDELYALRSGLSRVSQENDKVVRAKETLESKKSTNEWLIKESRNKYGDLNYFQARRNEIVNKFNAPNQNLIKQKNNLLGSIKYENGVIEQQKKKNLPFFIVGGIALVLSVFFIIFGLSFKASDLSFLSMASIPLGVVLLVCLVKLYFSYDRASAAKKSKANLEIQLEKLNAQIIPQNQINANIHKDKEFKDIDAKLIQAKLDLEKAKNFDYSPLENALSEQKNASVEFYKEFYPSYLARFEKVLDPRDWCNLDLVIFILETGRADNLRDALIQVDGYRHTEAIVKAVNSASQAICRTITTEADRLQRAIATHVDIINSNLIAIAEGQKSLNSSLGVLNSSIAKQINATELQNALIEKANTSSDKLAKDIEEIRNYFIK